MQPTAGAGVRREAKQNGSYGSATTRHIEQLKDLVVALLVGGGRRAPPVTAVTPPLRHDAGHVALGVNVGLLYSKPRSFSSRCF